MDRRVELLSKVPLFSALRKEEVEELASVVLFRQYSKNESILMEDEDSAHSMFVIVSGKIRISVSGFEGREAILAIMDVGEYFGEMSVIDGEPRSASVHAVENSELMILRREDLLKQIQNNPKLALSMLIEFSKRLRIADTRITSLALLGVYGRVANIMMELAKQKGKRVGDVVIVDGRPTHQEIAEMSGTTRETVSRVLGKLQRAGVLIIEKNKIIILRMDDLRNDEQEKNY